MGRFRNGMITVAALAACVVLASSASAGHGNGRGHGKGHHKKNKRYVSYCAPQQHVYYAPQPVYYAPQPVVYEACAPRYVTYRPQHVAIVRPTPYVHVGARIGAVDISAVFGGNQGWSNYDYGCNFCEAHYSSYGGYENHVQNCGYRPANTRIECRRWDRDGYSQYRGQNDDRYYNEDDQG